MIQDHQLHCPSCDELSLEERLEYGQVVYFEQAPFRLPAGDDHQFLLRQNLGASVHKNVSYNPHTARVGGFARQDHEQQQRLRAILADFARTVTGWLADALPRYQGGCEPDRVSYRPEEESLRKLRLKARNDLLHVDAFPGRPARGRRILRVFANINPTEPRIWVTSDPLPVLVDRYREPVEQHRDWLRLVSTKMVELFRPARSRRSRSDWFMLRMHDYLKGNDDFQHANRRVWHFPPGSVWLAMTDACSHAVLRGRYALEHSYFIAPQVLVRPDLSPDGLLAA
jgi:hypothetical protein